jgi:hypothetical protein
VVPVILVVAEMDCAMVVLLSLGAIAAAVVDVVAKDDEKLWAPIAVDSAEVCSMVLVASVKGASWVAPLLWAAVVAASSSFVVSEALSVPTAVASSAAWVVASFPAPASPGAIEVNSDAISSFVTALTTTGAGALVILRTFFLRRLSCFFMKYI